MPPASALNPRRRHFDYAAANAARLIGPRAEIRLEDWNSASGPFDLIFCNPPYIPSTEIESLAPDVSRFEPRAALDGGPDGLAAYRALAKLLPGLLKPGGHALLEIGVGQALVHVRTCSQGLKSSGSPPIFRVSHAASSCGPPDFSCFF